MSLWLFSWHFNKKSLKQQTAGVDRLNNLKKTIISVAVGTTAKYCNIKSYSALSIALDYLSYK